MIKTKELLICWLLVAGTIVGAIVIDPAFYLYPTKKGILEYAVGGVIGLCVTMLGIICAYLLWVLVKGTFERLFKNK